MTVNRSTFVGDSRRLVAEAAITALLRRPRYQVVRRQPQSRVAILRVESYSQKLGELLHHSLEPFRLDVRGKTVLLKPNLVDYIPGNHINTHPLLVSAAIECFRRLGAAAIVVGEGPGHQRDTELVLSESGMSDQLRQQKARFVDLNRDELIETPLRAGYTNLERLWLPRTVLAADFVVSMPKVKTHHWSGVTLSMKNMFGVVPGAKYGWPKNILHWKGIERSILDVCATVPVHFIIADAIVAMEGNGPLNGTPRSLHRIILSDDPVAADATCTRLMGLDPAKIAHIRAAAQFLGNFSIERIDQLGEPVRAPVSPFQLLPEFEYLRETNFNLIFGC
ncbi:MAG TPA: DUF362 domain-containing protein [Candidatus Acidoferrales bacterium]|nr:DUF362 domain-containing protein [Candidatus Acidoferrales bacterium]